MNWPMNLNNAVHHHHPLLSLVLLTKVEVKTSSSIAIDHLIFYARCFCCCWFGLGLSNLNSRKDCPQDYWCCEADGPTINYMKFNYWTTLVLPHSPFFPFVLFYVISVLGFGCLGSGVRVWGSVFGGLGCGIIWYDHVKRVSLRESRSRLHMWKCCTREIRLFSIGFLLRQQRSLRAADTASS